MSAVLRMLLIGAIFGTVLDGIHTHSGMTSYPHPVYWMAAWWTPPLFAAAFLAAGLGYRLGEPRTVSRLRTRASIGGAAFALSYFLSGYLPASNPVKLAVLLTGAAILWGALDRSLATVALAIASAMVGPAIESFLVSHGAFLHLHPDFAGVPMWLPGLYAASAVGLGPFVLWASGMRLTRA